MRENGIYLPNRKNQNGLLMEGIDPKFGQNLQKGYKLKRHNRLTNLFSTHSAGGDIP